MELTIRDFSYHLHKLLKNRFFRMNVEGGVGVVNKRYVNGHDEDSSSIVKIISWFFLCSNNYVQLKPFI